jgi:hypothetical protein
MISIHPFIRLGILLHMVTFIEALFVYSILYSLHDNGWFNNDVFFLKKIILYPFILMPLFPQLDAYCRYQNYKQLRDLFYEYGFNVRFVKPFIKSRCQRDAVLAAANDLGFGDECKKYFEACGYKWYHFFPDFMFSQPQFLLSKQFWLTTFFTKNYSAKIDVATIKLFRVHQLQYATV